MEQHRIPKGVRTAGQFAQNTHTEPDMALPYPGDPPPVDMSPERIHDWVAAQASHHLSPVIGWIRRDAANGKDTSGHLRSFDERVNLLAADVAEKFTATPAGLEQRADATNLASEAIREHLRPVFQDIAADSGDKSRLVVTRWRIAAEAAADAIGKKVTAPVPVMDGFTAADVEDYLAREQHDRQCGCPLQEDRCSTSAYGEHWRHRLGVPDVAGIFDAIQEMAAARREVDSRADL